MRLDMYMCNRDLDALAMLEHANDETIRLVMRSLISTALFAMPCFDASLFAYPLLGNRCTSVCTIAILLEHYIGVLYLKLVFRVSATPWSEMGYHKRVVVVRSSVRARQSAIL